MRFTAHETYRPIMISKRKSNALSNALEKIPGNEQQQNQRTQTVITQT